MVNVTTGQHYFYDILLQIKSFRDYTNPFKLKHIPTSSEELSEDLNNWLESYLFINELNRNSIKITPYIHVFVNPIPQFLEIHQNINSFNTQGSEKLNGFCTHYYHRCTNKQHKKYLNQLFKKRNRIEFFNLNGQMNEFHFNDDDDDNDNVENSEDEED